MRAGEKPGTIETHEFIPEGRQLFVNADVGEGRLAVDVLDANGQVIQGYDQESSLVEIQDSVRLAIRWKDQEALPEDTPVRLGFRLENGDLFSYRVE